MLHHAVCKCFGLGVGEDVYDLRLPLVSRILDIDDTVWISCCLPSLVLSFIICIYFFFSLSYILTGLCAEAASPGYMVADRQLWHVPGLLNLGQLGTNTKKEKNIRRRTGMEEGDAEQGEQSC